MPAMQGSGSSTPTTPVNPLDSGNDPHSVDASAADFDRMLAQELPDNRKSNQRSETGRDAPRKADQPERANGRSAARSGDEPTPDPEDDLAADPFLGEPPREPKKGEPEPDDEPDEDETEDEPEDEGEDEDEDEEGDELGLDDIDPAELQAALLDKEFEVVVNGKTQNLPLSEILEGYSREADYRQKTARLSEERQEVEEFADKVVNSAKHYEAKLVEFEDLTKAFRPTDAEWNALKASNPQLFIETKEQWDNLDKKIAEAKAERDRIAQEAADVQTRNFNAYVRQENEKLYAAVPALRNPQKAKEFRQFLVKTGERLGFTAEELAESLIDHRAILTMYRAGKYEEILAARKANGKKQGNKRGRGRAATPGPSATPRNISRKEGRGNAVRDAERRHARTGTVQSAGEAFAELIRSDRI